MDQQQSSFESIPEAFIPTGTWKYIQIQVIEKSSGKERLFVRGYEGMEYHMNVMERFKKTELSKVTGGLANF